MSLFNDLLGGALGSVLGNQSSSTNALTQILNGLSTNNTKTGNNLLAGVMNLVQQNGGLVDVLGKFAKSGLANEANSWVGTGPNKPISANHIQQVFGNQSVQQIASQLGMSQQDTGSAIAKILPELINQLTPKGNVPDNHQDLFSQGLAMLSKLAK